MNHYDYVERGVKMKTIIILIGASVVYRIYMNKVTNTIKPDQAKEMMDKGDAVILDVRTPEEYKRGHIKKALLIPSYDIKRLAQSKLHTKEAKILVYCASGGRSRAAAKALIKMGYTKVYNIGGIRPYETVTGK